MNNSQRRWHHIRRTIRRLKLWQLIVIFILMGFVSATFLRLDNIGMLERRQAVTDADTLGDEAKIKTALTDLQNYVAHHMNTDLGKGVPLQASYSRAVDSVFNQTGDLDQKSKVYQEAAKEECQRLWKGGVASFRNDYVQCVVQKVSAQAPSANLGTKLPRADLYYFDYVSPRWSPDVAGLTVLLTGVVGVIIVTQIALSVTAVIILRRRTPHF
ncbi:MAG: hypothetical protein ACMG55_17240 [Microcoleus sp.]